MNWLDLWFWWLKQDDYAIDRRLCVKRRFHRHEYGECIDCGHKEEL